VDVDVGGVDHEVGVRAEVGEDGTLAPEALDEAAAPLQRVRSASGLLAAYQHVVGRVQEQQRRTPAQGVVGEVGLQRLEERAGADVDDDRDRLVVAATLVDQLDDLAQQRRRQVVDDVVAEVLELLGGRAAAGAGHPGDDHDLAAVLGGQRGDRLAHQPSSVISPVAVLTV
jgi:hypothetical protein